MNILWLIQKYHAAIEEKEKKALRKEIDDILARGPLTFKDVTVIIAGIGITSIIVLSLAQAIIASIGIARSKT